MNSTQSIRCTPLPRQRLSAYRQLVCDSARGSRSGLFTTWPVITRYHNKYGMRIEHYLFFNSAGQFWTRVND